MTLKGNIGGEKKSQHGCGRWAPAPRTPPIVIVSQWPSITVVQCLGVPVSWYPSIPLSWCPSVQVSQIKKLYKIRLAKTKTLFPPPLQLKKFWLLDFSNMWKTRQQSSRPFSTLLSGIFWWKFFFLLFVLSLWQGENKVNSRVQISTQTCKPGL